MKKRNIKFFFILLSTEIEERVPEVKHPSSKTKFTTR